MDRKLTPLEQALSDNVANTADVAEAFGADLSVLPQHVQDAVREAREAREKRNSDVV